MTEVATKPITQPQKFLLMELVRSGPQRCAQNYAPAKHLVARGFARWINNDESLACTLAGRSHYEEITSQ